MPVTEFKPQTELGVTDLVAGIVSDAGDLLKQHLALTMNEIRQDLNRTREASRIMGTGIGLALAGVLMLMTMMVKLTVWLMPSWPEWTAYLVWGFVLLSVGVGFYYRGRHLFASFNPLPEESVQVLKENAKWIKKQL